MNSPSPPTPRAPLRAAFRGDIQGLRALAVALVVVFHLSPSLLPGGYLGVDIFFVISGFLITSHLLREGRSTGSVKLRRFWARRIRRLLPASFLVLLVSALLVIFVLPRTTLLQNLNEIAFATIYGLNWNLAAESVNYLAADHTAGIAQHYWSLSVEEQFYVAWPLLLIAAIWLTTKLKVKTPEPIFIVIMLLVLAGSFAFSVLETLRSPSSAYFVTTTRAWEFAAGGLLAVMPTAGKLRREIRNLLSWSAIGTIVLCSFRFGPDTAFPGWIAVVPVAAAAMLIWVGDDPRDPWAPQYIAHAAPIQFTGNISYSLYLWHWPIIVTYIAIKGEAPSLQWVIALIAMAVILASLTERFVERPFREPRSRVSSLRVTYGGALVAMAVVLAVAVPTTVITTAQNAAAAEAQSVLSTDEGSCFGAFAIHNGCDSPYEVTETVIPSVTIEDGFGLSGSGTWACSWEVVADHNESKCDITGADTSPGSRIVLFGDSHAEQFAPALEEVALENGWSVSLRARAACTGVGATYSGSDAAEEACSDWGRNTLNEIAADEEVGLVLITARYEVKPADEVSLRNAIKKLTDANKVVALIRDAPGIEHEWADTEGIGTAPACVERSLGAYDPCSWVPTGRNEWAVNAAVAESVPVIDPWKVICADGTCHSVIGGVIVYADSNHLSRAFSRSLSSWLAEEIQSTGWRR